jgi:hypothetical protein
MDQWVSIMEDIIIPFQEGCGMLITSSNRGFVEAPGTREALAEPDSTYVWTRYFSSEAQREALYAKVYGSTYWTETVGPIVPECVDVKGIISVRVQATATFPEGIGAENARRGGGFGGMSSGRGKIASEAFYELRQYPILPVCTATHSVLTAAPTLRSTLRCQASNHSVLPWIAE